MTFDDFPFTPRTCMSVSHWLTHPRGSPHVLQPPSVVLGSFLVVQWLGLGAFIGMAWTQSLVRELKSHWPHSQKANEQEEKEQWFKIVFIRTHMPVRERSHFIKMLKGWVFFKFFIWWKFSLQCSVGFCCTTMEISHNYIYSHSLPQLPPSHPL